jgi:hypothetical protein
MISATYFRLTARLAVLSMVVALAVQGQTTKVINVNEPRPLWSALDQLEVANPGVAINYEDPPYENLADVQHSATPQQQAAHPGFHLIVPRAGAISADITLSSTPEAAADVIGNLNRLLVSYRQNALPGDFKLEQANGVVYVTPITVLGANGSSREVTSPMTTLISIPSAKRSVPETAQAIFDAVSKATGLRFGIATFPFRPTDQVTFAASNEPARDALARLFALVRSAPVSYRLLFEPKPDPKRAFDYMVNVHLAGFVPPQAPPGLGRIGPTGPIVTPPQTTGSRPGAVSVKQ